MYRATDIKWGWSTPISQSTLRSPRTQSPSKWRTSSVVSKSKRLTCYPDAPAKCPQSWKMRSSLRGSTTRTCRWHVLKFLNHATLEIRMTENSWMECTSPRRSLSRNDDESNWEKEMIWKEVIWVIKWHYFFPYC